MSAATAAYPSPSSSYNNGNSNMSHAPESHDADYQEYNLFNYRRIMHAHTKKQMEAASRSARRRSANADAEQKTGHSATASTDSTSSSGSL